MKTKNYNIKTFGEGIIGGQCLLPGCLPHLLPTFKYYQWHSQGARPQAPWRPVGQSQGAASQALAEARQRQAVSEC